MPDAVILPLTLEEAAVVLVALRSWARCTQGHRHVTTLAVIANLEAVILAEQAQHDEKTAGKHTPGSGL